MKLTKYGLITSLPNDLTPEPNQKTIDLLTECIPVNSTVLHAGAHIGRLTIPLAKRAKNLIAFEPQRLPYYSLCANCLQNDQSHVICLQQAVGQVTDSIRVPEINLQFPQNLGDLNLTNFYEHGNKVKMIRIDDLKLVNLHLLVLDVNSMELKALQGAQQTLRALRPTIYVRSYQDQATKLLRQLRAFQYTTLIHAITKEEIYLFSFHQDKPCPVDPDKHDLQPITRDKALIELIVPDPKDTIREINRLEDGIIENYVKMAEHLGSLHEVDKALEMLQKTHHLQPRDWRLYYKAVNILSTHGRYRDALNYAEIALNLDGPIDVTYARAILLGALGRHHEAIACYNQVLEFRPDDANAHFNKAIDLLKTKQYREGWAEYEWRFKTPTTALLNLNAFLPNLPMWEGQILHNKRILLFLEQGVGDQIQMLRYIKDVKALGATTVVSCYPAMERLLKTIKEIDEVVVHKDDISLPEVKCDYMQSLMSLPRIFDVDDVSLTRPDCPYIKVKKTNRFCDVSKQIGKKVGICWAGNETHALDYCRSCKLEHFQCLQQPGITLVNLQMSQSNRYWVNQGYIDLLAGADITCIDPTPKIRDFKDTADLLRSLDLVVTVDTSVAHLAGAMGVPCWVALGQNSDWRWGTEGSETLWYPSLRLFRGDKWSEVFYNIKEALNELNITR
jgi:FkbM family methyltransferase